MNRPWEKWPLTQRLTYAAALFEARGSMQSDVRTVSGRTYRQFRLRVRADNWMYILLLQDLFGGTASPMSPDRPRVWVDWRVFGDAAIDALKQLQPYMVVRADEARPFIDGEVPMRGRVEEKKTRKRVRPMARVARPRVNGSAARAEAR